ncbi:MAG: hypothetical protein JO262_20840, partial [Solirubrobacterales bacterium]|nr:hypothetical protein [Solirubrobacterales bacterium]
AAFFLAVVAVGLVPAPTRAGEGVRKNEEKTLQASVDQRPVGTDRARDDREAEPASLGKATVSG